MATIAVTGYCGLWWSLIAVVARMVIIAVNREENNVVLFLLAIL